MPAAPRDTIEYSRKGVWVCSSYNRKPTVMEAREIAKRVLTAMVDGYYDLMVEVIAEADDAATDTVVSHQEPLSDLCKALGHNWPYQPSVFQRYHAEPSTDTCKRCGCVRTIHTDNSRTYTFPERTP